jgi:CRP/FNR family transcriptional regulator
LTPSGRAVGIDVVGPGSPLGVESIIEGSPFRASVVSLEETTCAVVSRGTVLTLLDRRPSLLRALVSEANEQLVCLMERIAELAAARVEVRLAHVFLALAGKFGDRENGKTVVRVALLRQDLADLTGTTLETCIRVMSRWKKQGIVRSERRGFVIDDRKILEMLRQC